LRWRASSPSIAAERSASSGDDLIRGGGEDDRIVAGAGEDRIVGGAGRDRIYGEDGADLIDGGPGGDTIDGGKGNDRIVSRDGEADSVDGWRGIDRAEADERDALVDVEAGAGGKRRLRPRDEKKAAEIRAAAKRNRARVLELIVHPPRAVFDLTVSVDDPAPFLKYRFDRVLELARHHRLLQLEVRRRGRTLFRYRERSRAYPGGGYSSLMRWSVVPELAGCISYLTMFEDGFETELEDRPRCPA